MGLLLFTHSCKTSSRGNPNSQVSNNSNQCVIDSRTDIYSHVYQRAPGILYTRTCDGTELSFQQNRDSAFLEFVPCESMVCSGADSSVAGPPTEAIPAQQEEQLTAPAGISPSLSIPSQAVWLRADALENNLDALAALGPFVAYAWLPSAMNTTDQLDDLAIIRQRFPEAVLAILSPSYQKIYTDLFANPSNLSRAKSLQVSITGYNTEGFQSCVQGIERHTPCIEVEETFGPSLEILQTPQNRLLQFIDISLENGFKPFWGPIRTVLDNISDTDARLLRERGLYGIGIQEQNYIQDSCANERLAAFDALQQKFNLSGAGAYNVQLMSLYCRDRLKESCEGYGKKYGYCLDFAEALMEQGVNIGLWTNDRDDSAADIGNFLRKVREL